MSVHVGKRTKSRGRLVSKQPLVLPGYQDDTNELLRCTCHQATLINGQRKFPKYNENGHNNTALKCVGLTSVLLFSK